MNPVNIHATGLVIGGIGVLIRGPSGAGKSLLALELLDAYASSGEALLVADDRIELVAFGAGLAMQAPATIAGLIELRGRGIVERPYRRHAPVHLVVDLVESLERMPEPQAFAVALEGVELARAPVPRRGVVDGAHQRLLIAEALAEIHAHGPGLRQKTT